MTGGADPALAWDTESREFSLRVDPAGRVSWRDSRAAQRLEEMRVTPPEQEVAQLSRAYAAEKDLGVRFTLHQAIKRAQRKIELQSRLGEARRQLELKLAQIEQGLGYLRSQQQLVGRRA